MKLITEVNEEITHEITEGANGKKALHIEGIFMQADMKNRNGRRYPKDCLLYTSPSPRDSDSSRMPSSA